MPRRHNNRTRKRRPRPRQRGGGWPLTRSNADPGTLVPVPRILPRNQQMVVQVRNYLTATSDGSGIINSFIAFDPTSTTTARFGSVTLFPEWASIAALFQRVKLMQFDVHMTTAMIDDTKGDTLASLLIASNMIGTAAAPGTAIVVADNADSISWPVMTDRSGQAKYFSRRVDPRSLAWGSIASPAGSTGIGCPGCFVFYGNFGGFVSLQIFNALVVGTYLVDTRV